MKIKGVPMLQATQAEIQMLLILFSAVQIIILIFIAQRLGSGFREFRSGFKSSRWYSFEHDSYRSAMAYALIDGMDSRISLSWGAREMLAIPLLELGPALKEV